MQGPMLKALRRFTQLLRVHIYVPGCCKYIRMTNGLQPLVELCMDGSFKMPMAALSWSQRQRPISGYSLQLQVINVNLAKS